MAFLLHLLRPEDLFCDVGANAGVYTVLAAGAVGCHAIAIEPIPKTYDLLMQNIYANGISRRVDARNIGVGNIISRLHFTSTLWSYNHVVDNPGENTIEVDVLPLDLIIKGAALSAIKIDVEGFEAQVVAGATETFSDPSLQAIVIEIWEGHLARYNSTLAEILTALKKSGFSGPYWHDPKNHELITPGTQEKRKFNQIFIRDFEHVSRRVKSSRRYKIHGAQV